MGEKVTRLDTEEYVQIGDRAIRQKTFKRAERIVYAAGSAGAIIVGVYFARKGLQYFPEDKIQSSLGALGTAGSGTFLAGINMYHASIKKRLRGEENNARILQFRRRENRKRN